MEIYSIFLVICLQIFLNERGSVDAALGDQQPQGVSAGNYGRPGATPTQFISHGTYTGKRKRGSGAPQQIDPNAQRGFDGQPRRMTKGQKMAARQDEGFRRGYLEGYQDALNGVPSRIDNGVGVGVGVGGVPYATTQTHSSQSQTSTAYPTPMMSPAHAQPAPAMQSGGRASRKRQRGTAATTQIDPNQAISPIGGGGGMGNSSPFPEPHHFQTGATQGGHQHQHQMHQGRTQFAETQTSQTSYAPTSGYEYSAQSAQATGTGMAPPQLERSTSLITNGEEMEQVQELGLSAPASSVSTMTTHQPRGIAYNANQYSSSVTTSNVPSGPDSSTVDDFTAGITNDPLFTGGQGQQALVKTKKVVTSTSYAPPQSQALIRRQSSVVASPGQ